MKPVVMLALSCGDVGTVAMSKRWRCWDKIVHKTTLHVWEKFSLGVEGAGISLKMSIEIALIGGNGGASERIGTV